MNNNKIVIKVSELTKLFGELRAVDNLSLEIKKGEIFGFLGPNGAGKTTTINMICGLVVPSDGVVKFFGKRIVDEEEIKSQIGICPQENILWPKLTCLEQLIFIGEMYGLKQGTVKKKGIELLEFLGLKEKSNVLAGKLSGGMKRRLNICLALIHDPAILVLDEPEAGLDPQSRILVRDFIKSLKSEKTIILTTHNMDEADRLSDRIAIIDHGRLLLLDTPANLKKTIGEGDVLEIILDDSKGRDVTTLTEDLKQICGIVKFTDSALMLNAKNIVHIIPDITVKIKESGFNIKEITMRENTLEDVFIHLTGRKLRQ